MEKITKKEIKIIDVPIEDIINVKNWDLECIYGMMCEFMSSDYLIWIYDIHSNDTEDLIGYPVTSLENEIKEVIEAPNYFPM